MANTEVQESSLWLRREMDEFIEEFEREYNAQATKKNLSSERRMRKLLRGFRERVYEPYRDMTNSRDDSPTVDGSPVPF